MIAVVFAAQKVNSHYWKKEAWWLARWRYPFLSTHNTNPIPYRTWHRKIYFVHRSEVSILENDGILYLCTW